MEDQLYVMVIANEVERTLRLASAGFDRKLVEDRGMRQLVGSEEFCEIFEVGPDIEFQTYKAMVGWFHDDPSQGGLGIERKKAVELAGDFSDTMLEELELLTCMR